MHRRCARLATAVLPIYREADVVPSRCAPHRSGTFVALAGGKQTIEVIMKSGPLCPFYAKGEDWCEVGCGHISVFEVTMIVDYCTASYTQCGRYKQLMTRVQECAASSR
jgi:hypothetical protein